jgi:C-terminal processing protease CtpA/Prc
LKKLLLVSILLSIFFSACADVQERQSLIAPQFSLPQEKEEPLSNENHFYAVKAPSSCSIKNQNQYLYEAMHDSYLWSNSVPILDSIDHYSSPEELLKMIRDENDLFSHIVDLKKVNRFFGLGRYNNFGFIPFLIQLKNGKEALGVVFVYPNSPAQRAGMKRGDIITQVDNISTQASNLERIKKKLKKQKQLTFTFWKKRKRYKKRIIKYDYAVHTISHVKIYHIEDKKIGYMVFSDFIPSKEEEIDRIFKQFKSAQIDDLILDLRYNGGGDMNVARHLSSLIGGAYVNNRIFTHYLFNSKYAHLNYTTHFKEFGHNQLNLNRLFIITSKRTCSASEQLILNLRASDNQIEVIQIGQETCGKPYAYNSIGLFCDKALFLINTKAQNSDHEMISSNGLYPTCVVEDNIHKAFGDREESSLKEALYYITHNRCSSQSNNRGHEIVDFIGNFFD